MLQIGFLSLVLTQRKFHLSRGKRTGLNPVKRRVPPHTTTASVYWGYTQGLCLCHSSLLQPPPKNTFISISLLSVQYWEHTLKSPPPFSLTELSESSSDVDMTLKNLIMLIHCLPLNKMLQREYFFYIWFILVNRFIWFSSNWLKQCQNFVLEIWIYACMFCVVD